MFTLSLSICPRILRPFAETVFEIVVVLLTVALVCFWRLVEVQAVLGVVAADTCTLLIGTNSIFWGDNLLSHNLEPLQLMRLMMWRSWKRGEFEHGPRFKYLQKAVLLLIGHFLCLLLLILRNVSRMVVAETCRKRGHSYCLCRGRRFLLDACLLRGENDEIVMGGSSRAYRSLRVGMGIP